MKKISLLIISLLISFSVINTSNANNLENILYKSVTLTKIQVQKDYGTIVNEKIVSIFIKYRHDKDIITLGKLEILLKGRIRELNNKSYLSQIERKKLNLYNNLYYRIALLLNYNLK